MNPVVLLDEVDKLGTDFRGDPASALLEVLDPAQNHTFRDHYLELELDLSDVLFLATANVAETIPDALLDRMEVIRLDGYTEEEKVAIARHHLVGRQLERAALSVDEVTGLNAFNYQQTKRGVIGLTKFSAGQLGRYGITVNCLAPGVIDTAATRSVVPLSAIEQLAKLQAVPGVLHAEDLTGAAVYFASEEARYVTGQVLVIDGGKYMPA